MAGWGRTWVPAAVVAALVLAGCGGGDDAGEATRAPGVGEVEEQPGGTEGDAAADVDTGDTGGADGAAGSAGEPTAEVVLAATAGREVIRTAEVVVEVDDLAGATDRATALVTAAGGYLESGRAGDDGGWPSTRAVYRVPPDAFDRLLGDLADLGDEIDRRVELDDVTGTVVDLRGRRLAVEASVARLRELFDDAGDVGAVVAVESELVRREAELESLTGQLRALEQRVALATVTLTLEERTEPVLAATGPVQALGDGARAFAATVGVVLVALAWSAPFLAALAVLVALAVVVRRWLRRTPVTPTTSEPAPAEG
jgi:hypothetical protein